MSHTSVRGGYEAYHLVSRSSRRLPRQVCVAMLCSWVAVLMSNIGFKPVAPSVMA